MSDIDFQNGFIVGMATRGLTKSETGMDGDLLAGHLVANGSRGVWPLVLSNGAWRSRSAPTSAIYALNVGPIDPNLSVSLAVSRMQSAVTAVVS